MLTSSTGAYSSVSPKQDGRAKSLDIFKKPGGSPCFLGENIPMGRGNGQRREGPLLGFNQSEFFNR